MSKELLDIIRQAHLEDYRGSIPDLLKGYIESQTEVMDTPEKQEQGLREGSPRTAVFPDVQGQPFNTVGMDYPIDMDQYDHQGNLVRSYKELRPGLVDIPTDGAHTVIENPSLYRTGGMCTADRMKSYRPGSTLRKK